MTESRGITVVIPCYNTGDYVRDAVESVLTQPALVDIEVVLVDDHSDDPTTCAALADCARSDEVRLVRLRQRCGVQRARTIGVKAARCAYILPLDSDDRLTTAADILSDSTYLDHAVEILESDPDTAFVHTLTQMFGDCDGLTISSYPCHEDLIVRKHHVPTTIVYRRTDGIAAGGYNPAIQKWQDWAFAIALLAGRHRRGAENQIGFVDGPFVQYRIHAGPNRISSSIVSELDMTRLVVAADLDYFQYHHGNHTAESIAHLLCQSKPTRLDDLLHMAHYNLDHALTLAHQRGAELTSPLHDLGIP